MRFLAVVGLTLLAATPGNAARLRLAESRIFAECISNCNSTHFSCSQNCGLSGACVVQCNTEAEACKRGCASLK